MRHLLQPRVLNQACLAAAATALACYPRLSLWLKRSDSIVLLEIAILTCGAILWGFVFAWHAPYTGRPVFVFKIELIPFLAATAFGIGAAAVAHFWLDPCLRTKLPEEYPPDWEHWLAAVPFSLAIGQLFLVFAPFDWLMRLLKKPWLAMALTATFGYFVLGLKIHSLDTPLPLLVMAALFAGRFVSGLFAVWFYLRGGVLLVWWWTFIFEARHWWHLMGHG